MEIHIRDGIEADNRNTLDCTTMLHMLRRSIASIIYKNRKRKMEKQDSERRRKKIAKDGGKKRGKDGGKKRER